MTKLIPNRYRQFLTDRSRSLLAAPEDQSITARGFWIGSALSFFLAVAAPYNNMLIHGTYIALDMSTQGALFIFVLLIGVFNVVLKIIGSDLLRAVLFATLVAAAWLHAHMPLADLDPHRPGTILSTIALVTALANVPLAAGGRSLALNRAELIMVYVMLGIVSVVCTMGLSQQLVPMISSLFYFASAENDWERKLIPWLGDKHYMVDDGDRNVRFYEGLSEADQPLPYGHWVEPLLWWAILLLALFVVMVGVAVILRRQWLERERLAYPLAQVGLALIRGDTATSRVNGFFKSKAAWIGMAVPLIAGSMGALRNYGLPVAPPTTYWNFDVFGTLTALKISYSLLGFCYFIDTRIAASLWIFYLLARLQMSVLKSIGLKTDQVILYGAESPLLGWAGFGALLCMVIVGLYMARAHLGNVAAKALGRAPEVDDGDEILSYRNAVLGTAGGLAVITAWFWIMGTPLWIAALFTVVVVLVFIGITRIIVEAGVATLRAPMTAPDFVIYGLGSSLVTAPGVANLSIAYVWCSEVRAFVMAVCANALRLIQEMERGSRRTVFWAIILALGIGTLGATWITLSSAYRHGGINLGGYFFNAMNLRAFGGAERALEAGANWMGHTFMVGGAVLMGLLMWARQRLPWWPLHPIGFPISHSELMTHIGFNAFLAWTVKLLVLRLGGPNLYQRTQIFFLGLIAGQVMCNGIWLVIDYFTGKTGNRLLQF